MQITNWEKWLINRWKLSGRKQLWVVLLGFSLTGTLSAKCNHFLFVRIFKSAFNFELPFWLKPITITLIYPLVLIFVAWLLNEQRFFIPFIKNFYKKLLVFK